MKKVYTIVLMEDSAKEFTNVKDIYLHRGKWKFDSGLEMELLQEFFFIALDNFFEIEDNKNDTKDMSGLEAWLYFIGSDKPEHIWRVVENYPWFAELYEEVAYFRYHPEEAIKMFSDALRKLDENTVNFMIDEMKEELEEMKRKVEEKKAILNEKDRELSEKDRELSEKDRELSEKDRKLENMAQELERQNKEIEELKKANMSLV